MRLSGARHLASFVASVVSASLIALVLALYARHVTRNFAAFTVDDAAISYAYAHHVAHGEGFRLTANASPVEGFSNPLEVLLLVPLAWVGANLDTACKTLNLAAVIGAVLVLAVFAWRRLPPFARIWIAVPCAFGFLWPSFNHWIVAGLEGGLLCGLQILSITLLATSPLHRWRDSALGGVALLLALSRPEGVVYGGIVVAFRVFQPGRKWRPVGIFCAGFACILVVRYALFRQWVPNTYYAKITLDTHFAAGIGYVRQFWRANGIAYFACLLPLFAFLSRGSLVAAFAALVQGLFTNCFAVLSGGDWMRHWRFMQPMQGPYWALCLLGLTALFSIRRDSHPAFWSLARPLALFLSVLPLGLSNWPDWEQRVQLCSKDHDVDMARIATVGNLYRKLGERLDLGRPILIADVDVGGMSYPPGIDVLDLGGLTDNVFGYSWTRRPAEIVDYLFLERQPDTIHTHGGWVGARPIHAFYLFQQQYRVMAPAFLSQLAVSWLTAIRSDLVDPPVAPVLSVRAGQGSVELLGLSSVETGPGQRTLFVHALQTGKGSPPSLVIRDTARHEWPVQWHAGYSVDPGPAGSPLLGKLALPASALPIEIVGTALRLSAWPNADNALKGAASMSRLPLFRLAGLPAPRCDVDDYLDPRANAGARARGLALLARLCGGGLSRADRARADAAIMKDASRLARADDRYDAYRAANALGLPSSTSRRIALARERARHTYTDEVALAWAASELSPDQLSPEQARAGLGALFLARQYEALLLTALSRGLQERPEIQDLLCNTVAALGLRSDLLPGHSCPAHPDYPMRERRQSFEDPSDPTLHVDGISQAWRLSRPPIPAYGGEGRSFLFIPPCRTKPCGEVTWGPLPWPGRHFGVLLAGPSKGTKVVVEARDAHGWSELGRVGEPANPIVLTPLIMRLPDRLPDMGSPDHGYRDVRVRIANQSPKDAMTVDAPTFLDLGD